MLETQDACRFVFCFTLLVATDIDVDKDNFFGILDGLRRGMSQEPTLQDPGSEERNSILSRL